MVDSSVWIESDFVQGFGNELFLAPVNIPVVFFSLFVLSVHKSLLNAVYKKCLEFQVGTMVSKSFTSAGDSDLS